MTHRRVPRCSRGRVESTAAPASPTHTTTAAATGAQKMPDHQADGSTIAASGSPVTLSADVGMSSSEAVLAPMPVRRKNLLDRRSGGVVLRKTRHSNRIKPAKIKSATYCSAVNPLTANCVLGGVAVSTTGSATLAFEVSPMVKVIAPEMGCPSAETTR